MSVRERGGCSHKGSEREEEKVREGEKEEGERLLCIERW